MLFLLFQLGKDRYALDTSRVVEVLPLVTLKRLPHAPKGIAGVLNYCGRPVPAIDLSELTMGSPSRERLSTRIIIINYPDTTGTDRFLGLVAEHATDLLRKDPAAFVSPGITIEAAPYLGPVLTDAKGSIQWLRHQQLLTEPVRQLLLTPPAELQAIADSES
jgi:chemotaxis-related protein WspB